MFVSCVHPVAVRYAAFCMTFSLLIVLSGFSMRLFFPGMSVGMVVYISWLHLCLCGCDGDVICVCHDLNRCTGWW